MNQPRILVFCDWAQEETFARLHGGLYFCACCGSTEHRSEPGWVDARGEFGDYM